MAIFKTKGVCSEKIDFEIENNTLKSVKFTAGCHGNLQALSALLEGMPVDEVITRLKGIKCKDRPTSCADQLVQALEEKATLKA